MHLPEKMEHWAVTSDSVITSTICCLAHWWLVIMSTEWRESFAQVIVCNHLNETQGKHFKNSGTMKLCVVPLIPVGLLTEGTTECELMIQESGCSSRCQCFFCVALRPHFISLSHGICQYCCQHTVSSYLVVLAARGWRQAPSYQQQ